MTPTNIVRVQREHAHPLASHMNSEFGQLKPREDVY
jgi:hypothetical protein